MPTDQKLKNSKSKDRRKNERSGGGAEGSY